MRRRDSASSICRLLRLAAAWVLSACAAAAAPEDLFPTIEIRQFEYLPEVLTTEPPPIESRGEPNAGFIQAAVPVTYPYRWLVARVTLPAAPAGVYALYVSGANRGVTAFVNRVQVGSTSVSDAETFGWNYPIFFTVPQSLLHAGENSLEFRMKLTHPGRAVIRGVQLAPHAALKGKYDRILFWRVTGPQLTTLIAVMIGAITLLMFVRRPSDTLYGWFAVAAWLGALRNGHFFVSLPIREWWYEIWALVPLQWMSIALVIFSFRLCGDRYPRLERSLMVIAFAWLIACLLSDDTIVRTYGYLALALLAVGMIGYVAVKCWQAPKPERLLLLLALLVTQVFGVLDLALLTGMRSSESRVYLMPYSVLLFSVVVGAMLVDAFARARARQEQINRELDERLAERERELNDKHQQVLRLERERTTTSERQRILRDIHDGLGSQLVSSIKLVERGELPPGAVADVLRECIDDLRLAIDSLKPAGDDLLAVLGNFRYRMEPRLANAGVRLEWRVDPQAGSPALSSEQVLHTLRIVQEAVTNALKHANPKCITLSFAQRTAGGWTLEIGDDGAGFVAAGGEGGEGLTNMRARARRAGLQLNVISSGEGTAVRIEAAPEKMGTVPIS